MPQPSPARVASLNPFANWSDYERARFVERGDLVADLARLLSGPKPAAVQLVGPRWIGKTWVVHFLAGGGGSGGTARSIGAYTALQRGAVDAGLSQLTESLYDRVAGERSVNLQRVAEQVNFGVATSSLRPDERDRRLLTLAQVAAAAGIRLILYVDDFDRIATAEQRSLIPLLKDWSDRASLLLALRRPLVDLVSGIADSPLTHKLVYRPVGLLRPEEAIELLSPTPAPPRPFTGAEKAVLLRLVGPHPYLLRRAAEVAYDLVAGGTPLTEGEVWLAVAPALQTLFAHLLEEHEGHLVEFCRLRAGPATDWTAAARTLPVKRLHADAIVQAAGGAFEFACPLFEAFVAERLGDCAPAPAAIPAPAAPPTDLRPEVTLELGSNERRFLQLLAAEPGRVVTDEAIVAELWPGETPSAARHRLHTTAQRTRLKLRDSGSQITVVRQWGMGYAVEK